jgi:xanthine dehydrogenase large subunit
MNNLDAANHTTGRSLYLDDIPVLKNTRYGVILGSTSSNGTIAGLDLSAALALPGIIRIFTWKDIPGKNDIGGIISDETLFAEDTVHYQGQPVALIVACDEPTARKAMKLIKIEISELEAITEPRLAKEKGQLLIPSRTFRMGDTATA